MLNKDDLVRGAIRPSVTRISIFLILLIPMAALFGYEVSNAFWCNEPIQQLSCSDLVTNGPADSFEVELSGIDAERSIRSGFHPLEKGFASSAAVYVPLLPSNPSAASVYVLAKLYDASTEGELRICLANGNLKGMLRYPYSNSPFCDEEASVVEALVPDADRSSVWILVPDEFPSDVTKNPWYVLGRSILIGTGIVCVLIMAPLKHSFFDGYRQQLRSVMIGGAAFVIGVCILVENPRGPFTWNAYAPGIAMYGVFVGGGMLLMAAFSTACEFHNGTQKEKRRDTPRQKDTATLGDLRFEWKEVDDTIGIIAALIGVVIYGLVSYGLPFSSTVKLFGVAPVIIVSLAVCYLLPNCKNALQYFEHGIVLVSRHYGRVVLRFDEISSCESKVTHNLMNGVYSGTDIRLSIQKSGTYRAPYPHKLSVRRDTLSYERALELIAAMQVSVSEPRYADVAS